MQTNSPFTNYHTFLINYLNKEYKIKLLGKVYSFVTGIMKFQKCEHVEKKHINEQCHTENNGIFFGQSHQLTVQLLIGFYQTPTRKEAKNLIEYRLLQLLYVIGVSLSLSLSPFLSLMESHQWKKNYPN